jgi:cellulose synthase (UDP-forming)
MSDKSALALNLAAVGFFLIILPLLPRRRTLVRTLIVLLLFGLWARYLFWRVTETAPPDLASGRGVYYLAVLSIELVSFVSMLIFFGTLSRWVDRSPEADRCEALLRSLPPEQLPTVDVFLPTFNEGLEVLERSIIAARAIDYPRFQLWVLDDGQRDWLRDFCAAKGVGYIRRPDRDHAKAGNLNHALTVTNGELVAVFDADFTPQRNFLYRTVGFFFADQRIALVQTPQHFFNPDVFQVNLGLIDACQDNEREWYDVILPSRDAWDCAFWCGSCAVLRRDALEAIGGIPYGSVTEDALASLALLRRGYITRYLNERLSVGLMPEDIRGLTLQRQRWARGAMQNLFLGHGPLGKGLSWIQRVQFLQYHYLMDFPFRLLMLLLPLVYLWTGSSHFRIVSTADVVAYMGPPLIAVFGVRRWIFSHSRLPAISLATQMYTSARTFPAVLGTLLQPFGVPFQVTPKGSSAGGRVSDPTAVKVLLGLIVFTIGGIAYGRLSPGLVRDPMDWAVATVWALSSLILLCMILLAVSSRPRLRAQERFPVHRPGTLEANGLTSDCQVIDLSLTGALLHAVPELAAGDSLRLILEGVGTLPGTVIRMTEGRAAVAFEAIPEADRDRLIVYLYTSGLNNKPEEVDVLRVIWLFLRRTLVCPD